MKKTILLLTLSVIVLIFTGCKKGENDPFLSLRSRTARLSQNWQLTSRDFSVSEVFRDQTTYKYHATFDASTSVLTEITTNISAGNVVQSDTVISIFSFEFKINKDGTYIQFLRNDSDNWSFEGNWMWTHKSKNGNLKNKEAIVYGTTKYTFGNNISNYNGKTNTDGLYVIDKLSSKELILLINFSQTDNDGHTIIINGTQTFTKK